MHCVTNIHEDLYWLGGSDRQLAKFENVFPIPRGVSYNAYLVLDEKTVLLDTVDKAVGERFFENLEFALAGRPLDYVVVNHMEPDHCATLGELLRRWPGAQVVANAKTVPMVSQFFDCDISNRAVVIVFPLNVEITLVVIPSLVCWKCTSLMLYGCPTFSKVFLNRSKISSG